MELVERFDNAASVAGQIIDQIGADQLDLPTPCTEWSVRQVAEHVVGGVVNLSIRLRGDEPTGEPEIGRDLSSAFASAVSEARGMLQEPGALDRNVPTPFGWRPGSILVDLRIVEMLVHGWDLATATHQSTDFEPELSRETLSAWRSILGDGPRPEDSPLGSPQPPREGGSAADRLAAFFGRS